MTLNEIGEDYFKGQIHIYDTYLNDTKLASDLVKRLLLDFGAKKELLNVKAFIIF